jgi:putative hydrolase of the HAD superfamily
MIKAIIFDSFGVLAEDGWTPFKRMYLTKDPELAEKVSQLGKQVDSGERSYDDMITETAKLIGLEQDTVRLAVERKVPNEELFAYIQTELKPHYKIGMLSNASYNVLDSLFTPEQAALFDATALSYELGLTKPDPKMYTIAAERLGVAVNEVLFVDDQEKHCEGARALGMQALLYKNLTQLKHDLPVLLKKNQ